MLIASSVFLNSWTPLEWLYMTQFKIIPVYLTVDFSAGSQFLNYLKQAILHPVSVYPLLRQYIYEINQGKG